MKKEVKLTKGTQIIKTVFALAPFAMIAVCAVLYFTVFRNVTVEQLLRYTPENIWLAAVVIIGMFSLKSLTFFFPMLVIVTACGSAAPNIWAALLINTIGVFCMMNIPYLIGRFAQREFVEDFIAKHKKMQAVQDIKMSNEIFFIFFLRIINCLPYDVVSMFLGSTGTSWKNYIAGSMLGTLPGMILSTVMGLYMDDPLSPGCIISAALNVSVSIICGVTYLLYLRKLKKTKKTERNKCE
ncbi:MAG: TVP38/TMEM64 family protein [Oscillospiraceae bacterium]